MFTDRIEAGVLLAEKLRKYQGQPGVILAVPRGGVPVAYAVAKELGLPLDLILTKKIGHPSNREYAIGAVSLTDAFVIPHRGVSQFYIEHEIRSIRERLKEMYRKFMGDKEPESLTGKTVIVIDDGVATGNTLLGTISMLRKNNPAKIVIAVPIASDSAVEKLSEAADELVILLIPKEFYGVGAFYENFDQVSDEEVMYYLDKWKREIMKTG
ncbi:MAG TPA: phosphoribosyltransferase family protein [Puia sp.]|jgi:predicted phosphoribosyltransferase|nr:phosphoribosyltransferase family protein [Puia sp.]